SVLSNTWYHSCGIATAPTQAEPGHVISPPSAVFEIAPANVLHGAVRLHGSASLPTPETQVRVAWALAGAAYMPKARGTARKSDDVSFDILNPHMSYSPCATRPYRNGAHMAN